MANTPVGELELTGDYRLVTPTDDSDMYEFIFICGKRKNDGKDVVAFMSKVNGQTYDPHAALMAAFFPLPASQSSLDQSRMKHWVASRMIDRSLSRDVSIGNKGGWETYWYDADIMRDLWEKIRKEYGYERVDFIFD